MENVSIELKVTLPNIQKSLADWGNEQINNVIAVIELIGKIHKEIDTNVVDITTMTFPNVSELRENDFPCIVFNDDYMDEYHLTFHYNSMNSTLTIHLFDAVYGNILSHCVIGMNFMQPIKLLVPFAAEHVLRNVKLCKAMSDVIDKVISEWEQQKIEY